MGRHAAGQAVLVPDHSELGQKASKAKRGGVGVSPIEQGPLQGGSQHHLCLRGLVAQAACSWPTPILDFPYLGLMLLLLWLFPGGVIQTLSLIHI